jgi:hypothetical protein
MHPGRSFFLRPFQVPPDRGQASGSAAIGGRDRLSDLVCAVDRQAQADAGGLGLRAGIEGGPLGDVIEFDQCAS